MFLQITTEDTQTVNQAVQFGAIAYNVFIMLLVELAILGGFALKSLKTQVATSEWLHSNWFRFMLGLALSAVLATLIVVVPDVSTVLQTIGFNVDKSPLALGLAIGLTLVGATAEPSTAPEGDGKQ